MLVLAAALAGVLVALRSALDARLGRTLPDPLVAAVVTGLVAALGIMAVLATRGTTLPTWNEAVRIPAWMYAGGLAGGVSYALIILLTPRLGVATVTAWSTAGQTAFSLAADHYGWFGLEVTPLSWLRLSGGLVIVAGSWMVLKG
jgi:bacterial/archaeal transporter family-2 protein